MATTQASTGTTARGRARRPAHPARKALFGAIFMVVIGSFMPWVDTAAGSLSGAGGPGLWTFYAAMLGLAGALVPMRRLALAQAGIFVAVAIVLPVWQVAHVLSLVGTDGWMPGPGVVFVLGGGVLGASAVWRMLRRPV